MKDQYNFLTTCIDGNSVFYLISVVGGIKKKTDRLGVVINNNTACTSMYIIHILKQSLFRRIIILLDVRYNKIY